MAKKSYTGLWISKETNKEAVYIKEVFTEEGYITGDLIKETEDGFSHEPISMNLTILELEYKRHKR